MLSAKWVVPLLKKKPITLCLDTRKDFNCAEMMVNVLGMHVLGLISEANVTISVPTHAYKLGQ